MHFLKDFPQGILSLLYSTGLFEQKLLIAHLSNLALISTISRIKNKRISVSTQFILADNLFKQIKISHSETTKIKQNSF